ncbi:MAG TPA: hypothetical protein VIX17_05430 [Pyrinomonadaceae bacterium]|jgi:hypothetical protein
MMAKREVHYPHKIGFRVTDQTWFQIQREITETNLTPHDWCRLVVLDRLNNEFGLSRKERYFLHQILRTQFMVGHGFDVLADDKLTVELWRKYRDYSRQNVERLVKLSSEEFQLIMESKRHPGGTNAMTINTVFDED